MARGSSKTAVIRFNDLALLGEAERLAQEGFVTGASKRNWLSYGDEVELPEGIETGRSAC